MFDHGCDSFATGWRGVSARSLSLQEVDVTVLAGCGFGKLREQRRRLPKALDPIARSRESPDITFTVDALSITGHLLGAPAAFGLGRSAFRGRIERAMSGKRQLHNLNAALGRDGWRLVCLLRASPLTPFVAASYLLGLSAVTLPDYMLGTLAAPPALLGYVLLGALARAGLLASTGAGPPFQWALLAATVLAVAHVGALVAKVADGARASPA
jgi:SNARE associated Golgi protein